MIRLVAAAAAAAVSNPAGLWGVGLLVGRAVGRDRGAGVRGRRRVGENHTSCGEGQEGRRRGEDRGVERLGFGDGQRKGRCNGPGGDGYPRFGFLHLHWWSG